MENGKEQAGAAVGVAGAGESIDTPVFARLLLAWHEARLDKSRGTDVSAEANAIIAHIDARLARQHKGDPVAWMVGLDVFKSLSEAERNVRNPDLRPVPLYTTPAAAQAAQGDAVRDTEMQNDIDMVTGALDLCEPEDQAAFQRILAALRTTHPEGK